jgi:hypothetical protein
LFNLSSAGLLAQEIEANVTVNMEMVQPEFRTYVQNMKYDVENYINSQRFTENDWDGPRIPVEITIVLSGGNRYQFSARLLITGQRFVYGQEGGRTTTIRLLDDKWGFEYQSGAMFRYNPNLFNEFSSLLDFYLLIVIGTDMDSYSELGGTRAYEDARRIFQLGASQRAMQGWGTISNPGEYTRYNLINELLDMRYQELRLLFFDYYVDGLDIISRDREAALDNLAEIVDDIARFKRDKMVGPSIMLELFFNANGPEMAKLFEGYHSPDVFENLRYLDPTNTTLYETAASKRR